MKPQPKQIFLSFQRSVTSKLPEHKHCQWVKHESAHTKTEGVMSAGEGPCPVLEHACSELFSVIGVRTGRGDEAVGGKTNGPRPSKSGDVEQALQGAVLKRFLIFC